MLEPTFSLLEIQRAASQYPAGSEEERVRDLHDFIFHIPFRNTLGFFCLPLGDSASLETSPWGKKFPGKQSAQVVCSLRGQDKGCFKVIGVLITKGSYLPKTYQCLACFLKGGHAAWKILKESWSWLSGGHGF